MDVDLLFNKLKKYNDDLIVKQEAQLLVIELIYLCLKYRYSYQIGLRQETEWIDRIRELNLQLSIYEDYDLYNKIDFFKDGESLMKIYNDIVRFMYRQGYHDIPDLSYLFTLSNIISTIDYDGGCIDFINELWLRKYARGNYIKWYLCMIDDK